jgi:hypothetical protein
MVCDLGLGLGGVGNLLLSLDPSCMFFSGGLGLGVRVGLGLGLGWGLSARPTAWPWLGLGLGLGWLGWECMLSLDLPVGH